MDDQALDRPLLEQIGEEALDEPLAASDDGSAQPGPELTAICEALETLTGPIEVHTDSAYVEKCFNQNWHAPVNGHKPRCSA